MADEKPWVSRVTDAPRWDPLQDEVINSRKARQEARAAAKGSLFGDTTTGKRAEHDRPAVLPSRCRRG